MDCPDCGGQMVVFVVPEEYREFAPDDGPAFALCTHCLALHSSPETPSTDPDFSAVSDAFPTGVAAIPMALAVGLLDSLALHRSAVEELLAHAERAGTDPLLVLDRLASDPSLDPNIDLATRRRQVAQFREN